MLNEAPERRPGNARRNIAERGAGARHEVVFECPAVLGYQSDEAGDSPTPMPDAARQALTISVSSSSDTSSTRPGQ